MIYASDKRHGQVAVVEMVVVVVDVIVAVAAVVAVEVVITADGAAGGNGGGGAAADKQLCKVLSVLCIMHRFQHAARCNSDRPIRNSEWIAITESRSIDPSTSWCIRGKTRRCE